jgi:hypothetical protein
MDSLESIPGLLKGLKIPALLSGDISEAECKEKHAVWDPMAELTITSLYVDSNKFTTGNPMPEFTI